MKTNRMAFKACVRELLGYLDSQSGYYICVITESSGKNPDNSTYA